MRPSQKNRSGRNKSGRKPIGNVVNRVFESAGPEGKVRGTPQQIIDKYLLLARDAHTSSDRVAAENFLQHAEHYIRMLNAALEQSEERRQQFGGPRDQDDVEDDEDDRGERGGDQRFADHRPAEQRNGDKRSQEQRPFDQRRRDDQRPPRGSETGGQRHDVAPRRDQRAGRPAGGLETIDTSDGDAPALVPTPEDHATRSFAAADEPPAPPRSEVAPAPETAEASPAAPEQPAPQAAEEAAPRRAPRRRTRRAPAAEGEAGSDAAAAPAAPEGESALGDAQAPTV